MEKKEKQIECHLCGRKLTFWNTRLIKYKGHKICTSCSWKVAKEQMKQSNEDRKPKQISETRVTCLSCNNVWHYGKQEQIENCGSSLQQAGKAMMCCSGCAPALLIPNQKVTDFDKCPKCGSKAIKKENVVHDIK